MNSIRITLVAVVPLILGACVVAPVGPHHGAPAGVVYVSPTYAQPGTGFVWSYHATFGWGWRHPRHGWHRGWR